MTDVAALAGVSHQTVSRVLNNVGKVRPETRDRVLAAIKELGYRRNETARALATNQSKLIGIIAATDVNYGPSQTLFGIELAAKEAGYLVAVAAISEFSEEALREALNISFGLGVAGIIVIAPVLEVAQRLRHLPLDVPTVAVASAWSSDESRLTYVGVNQRAGAMSAVNHLIEKGCTSIAHIAGPSNWFDAAEREEGWREALDLAELPRGTLVRGDWSAGSGHALTRDLITQDLPDAIFSANDQMALGAMFALQEAEIPVPDKVQIVGFDNEPGAEFYSTPLTTVRQNFDAVGRRAIAALRTRIANQDAPNTLIDADLIVRASA